MSAEFYAYVRGASDVVPAGYSEAGLKAYRHLVFLGASQMIAASLPELRAQLDDAHWDFLLRDFIRQSAWTSHFYADMTQDFVDYLERVR